jgi:hypothetical protein
MLQILLKRIVWEVDSSNNAHNNTLNKQDSIANKLYDNDFNYKKF